MTQNRLLGPGLRDTWLQQTTELANELPKAERQLIGQLCGLQQLAIQQALCGCILREPALLSDTHRLPEVLGACLASVRAAALQKAQEALLQANRFPPPAGDFQVTG